MLLELLSAEFCTKIFVSFLNQKITIDINLNYRVLYKERIEEKRTHYNKILSITLMLVEIGDAAIL